MRSPLVAFAVSIVSLAALSGCAPKPPPRWAEGGAPVALTGARWHRGDDSIVIQPDGKVLRGGDPEFSLDAAGRVFEPDGEPVAVLEPDGHLVGRGNAGMGFVGDQSASFPGSSTAWFTIGPRGEVTRYDPEGERSGDGYWEGCVGPAARTCTLVTHVMLLREWQHRPRVGIGVGIGIGIMH